MRSYIILLAALPLAATGCWRPASTVSAPAIAPPAPAPSDAYPSKDEVLDYLDGKTITKPTDSGPDKGDVKLVLKRDQIEALQVELGGSSVDNGPWSTSITFITRADDGRYAVKMTVSHRRVENKRAFFGFRVQELAKQ